MKKIHFGVISASGMAQNHMHAIVNNKDACLCAICDIKKDLLHEAGNLLGISALYTDYREMLRHPGLDAVVICTPDQLHRQMTLEALEAGVHVLCEKPMALTMEDCTAMIHAGDKSPKKLMIGQICRYTPGFLKAKELIDEGIIGDLFFVESEYAHDYSYMPTTDNWRLDPLRHGYLGGGCHAVDLVRWVAGNPTEVMAYSNHKMLPQWPTDDCTIAIMQFPSGIIGKVFVSVGCKRNYTMRSAFYGTKGSIITDNTSPHMTVFRTDTDMDFTTPHLYPITINNHNTTGEIAEFVDIILADKPVRTTAREGASTVAAALAAIESTRTGMPVPISYNF